MPRRGHKKSRAGCVDCKRRHMKCDESQPACVNCKVASLTCSYLKSAKSRDVTTRSVVGTPAYSPLTPDTTSVTTTRQEGLPSSTSTTISASTIISTSAFINLDHLELLHHYSTLTYLSFTEKEKLAWAYRDTAIAEALRFPFLMYALLAVSAMHLCRLKPDRSDHYRTLAISLQEIGLAGFKDSLFNITKDNCVAVFIFSTTTGLHSFCDTFTFRGQNFNTFLERLTSCIRLMRGVRSVMDGGWWEYLRTTALSDLLATGKLLGSPTSDHKEETEPLWSLLDTTDLGPSSRKIYEDAVNQLQRVFNAEAKIKHLDGSVSMVFAWLVMLTSEYNEFLIQRRPEALVILAYYGVILHNRHAAWAVGADSGEFLITSISDYLGKHWERWLAWPKSVISSTPTATASNTPG